ncbi:hypothetical protein [Streptomyces rugosispiralis]|uniref:Uncharacterized protein n=1 Tax=Streptomyces rugosispiralis TaxID=2967341 RepID=A0ABT1V917_9ACTN|nr:hypothetical protein [Streptomyces rugosispiralis]MCQ8193893.1 hypothetical protein [Streptomyces rugosispiralis]
MRTQLGPLLNGFVNYEYWAPVPKMVMFPAVQELLNTYQEQSAQAGVDLLGHYMAPLAYAQLQVVAQAVEATDGFDQSYVPDDQTAGGNPMLSRYGCAIQIRSDRCPRTGDHPRSRPR